jgi:hypothetical protein
MKGLEAYDEGRMTEARDTIVDARRCLLRRGDRGDVSSSENKEIPLDSAFRELATLYESRRECKPAESIRIRLYGMDVDKGNTVEGSYYLGLHYNLCGDVVRAERYFQAALNVPTAAKSGEFAVDCRRLLAMIRLKRSKNSTPRDGREDLEKAEELLRENVSLLEEKSSGTNLGLIQTLELLREVLEAQGRVEEAERVRARAAGLSENIQDKTQPDPRE